MYKRFWNTCGTLLIAPFYRLTVTPCYLGGADRNRTDDLCSAIAALYQLSYSPNFVMAQFRDDAFTTAITLVRAG